jgi:hypothetical protein
MPNGSTGFLTRQSIVGNDCIAIIAVKLMICQPGRNRILSDRHRPVNTFPPVSAGLSIFPDVGKVGFYPIYKSGPMKDVQVKHEKCISK